MPSTALGTARLGDYNTEAKTMVVEITNEAIEHATELARCDGQIKTWTSKRDEHKDWLVSHGYVGVSIPTKSGDMEVAMSSDKERKPVMSKVIAVIGQDMYAQILALKQAKVTLGVSDIKSVCNLDDVCEYIAKTVTATVKKH